MCREIIEALHLGTISCRAPTELKSPLTVAHENSSSMRRGMSPAAGRSWCNVKRERTLFVCSDVGRCMLACV